MPDTVIEQVNNMLTKDSPAHLVFTDCQGKLLSDHNIESSEPAEDYDIPGVAYVKHPDDQSEAIVDEPMAPEPAIVVETA